jgi:hypothetical protein
MCICTVDATPFSDALEALYVNIARIEGAPGIPDEWRWALLDVLTDTMYGRNLTRISRDLRVIHAVIVSVEPGLAMHHLDVAVRQIAEWIDAL